MNQLFPRAEDLTLEEINYEFVIRHQPEEVFKLELSGKQRHLRQLFKEDQKEGRNHRSPYSISEEASHIEGRIENLAKALEKRVETKFESRVIHYWYRVKRAIARNDEEMRMRRDLICKIERIMQDFQFGPSLSPYKTQSNTVVQVSEEGAAGKTMNADAGVSQRSESSNHMNDLSQYAKGAIPKGMSHSLQETVGNPEPEFVVSRKEWEDMKAMMMSLMNRMAGANPNDRVGSVGNDSQRSRRSEIERQEPPRVIEPPYSFQQRAVRPILESRDSSTDNYSARIHRLPRESFGPSDEEDDYRHHRAREFRALPRYGVRRDREQNNRIEKWKLRFTGEPRSMSIENFLYKAKKLAEREGVPREILLRDIHLLLEGAASDWFFTFVDDLDTWDVFETNIVYRFGNPNKDQGIRTKIPIHLK